MQGAQKLRSEVPEGPRPSGTATTKLQRNAADGLFTKPSNLVEKENGFISEKVYFQEALQIKAVP
jgi:hypothetical protein